MSGIPIQAFNTQSITDEAALAVVTGRDRQRRDIARAIEANVQSGRQHLQHVLIHGPGGIGKSFMARLAQIEAEARARAGDPIVVVRLPEEHHHLVRNPHRFLADIKSQLTDLRQATERSWRDSMFRWPENATDEGRWSTESAYLDREIDQHFDSDTGLLIVIVENFDRLLPGVFKTGSDQELLRTWLARPSNRVMLIATADGVGDLGRLPAGSTPVHLDAWSADECVIYLNRLRMMGQQPLLAASEEAIVRAVSTFIEGNPRLVRLLGDALVDAASDGGAPAVAAVMAALADRLADSYRRRMDGLPPLAQGLLDALIRGGEPCSATDLAKRVEAGGQGVIARVMQDLQRAAMISGKAAPDGKVTLFRVVDRVFVHAYRLRQGSREDSQHLTTVLEWLSAFHLAAAPPADKPAAVDLFTLLTPENGPNPRRDAYRSGYAKRLAQWLGLNPTGSAIRFDALVDDLEKAPAALAEQIDALPPATLLIDRAVRTTAYAQALVRMGRREEALARLTALSQAPTVEILPAVFVKCELSLLLLCELDQDALAADILAHLEQSTKSPLSPSLRIALLELVAFVAHVRGDHERSLAAAREAAALAAASGDGRAQVETTVLIALSHARLGRHDEAVIAASEAWELANRSNDPRARTLATAILFFSHVRAGRPEEALEHAWLAGSDAVVLPAAVRDEIIDEALRLAATMPCRGVVSLCEGAIAATGGMVPKDRIYGILAAVTQAGDWADLDNFLGRQRQWLEQTASFDATDSASTIGAAIGFLAREDGRDAAREAARNVIQRLLSLLQEERKRGIRHTAFTAMLIGLVRECEDPDLLQDVAAILAAQAPQLRHHIRLLTSFAEIDGAGSRREGVLARLDPDIAVLVRQVRNLPDSPSRPRGRRRPAENETPQPRRAPRTPSESARM